MKQTKTVQVEQEKVVDILCNKCGKFTRQPEMWEFVELKVTWGYGSKKDQEKHLSHLCETCYDEFTATFSIPVEKAGHNFW